MTNPSELQRFGTFLRETADVQFESLRARVAEAGPNYRRVAADDLADPLRTTFLTLAYSIEEDDMPRLARYGREMGLRRARNDFTLQEMLGAANAFREHVWQRLDAYVQDAPAWSPTATRRMEDFLYTFYDNFIGSVGVALEQFRSELTQQAQELASQRDVIRELGVPIMPVHAGVLVLPLIGAIDSSRAVQIMETLLEAITHHQSDLVIIDITGVPTVDTSVANYLLQSARAANLVGAQIILVGIGAEVAQTIVQLGVDLSTIVTRANLQEGLTYAYERLGYRLE